MVVQTRSYSVQEAMWETTERERERERVFEFNDHEKSTRSATLRSFMYYIIIIVENMETMKNKNKYHKEIILKTNSMRAVWLSVQRESETMWYYNIFKGDRWVISQRGYVRNIMQSGILLRACSTVKYF